MKAGLFLLAVLVFGYGLFGLFAPEQWALVESTPYAPLVDILGFLAFTAGAIGFAAEFGSTPGSIRARMFYAASFAGVFLWLAAGNASPELATDFLSTCWLVFVFATQIGTGLNLMFSMARVATSETARSAPA